VLTLARELGHEVWSATSPAPSSTWPMRSPERHRRRGRSRTRVDDHAIGAGHPGPITRAIQSAFQDALYGRGSHPEWLDVVEVPERAKA